MIKGIYGRYGSFLTELAQSENENFLLCLLEVKGCSHGAIATVIFFIPTKGLYRIQSKCSHSAIATITLNPIQPISC